MVYSWNPFNLHWKSWVAGLNTNVSTILPTTSPALSIREATRQIEDLPKGYPQFAAFVASHPSFQVFRRFSTLRVRLLLSKQDQLSALEQQLAQIDRNETKTLFLGALRRDRNEQRKNVLKEIETVLAEYDHLADRNAGSYSRDQATRDDVLNVRNWLANTGSIARCETDYLGRIEDITHFGKPIDDHAIRLISTPVERLIAWLPKKLLKELRVRASRDPKVWVFSSHTIETAARILLTCLLVSLLYVPIVAIDAMRSVKARLFLIWVSSTLFILVLTALTKAKTSEVFMAGATYATVLVVFIAENRTP